MKLGTKIALGAIAAVTLAGCGGATAPSNILNPYTGAWSGTWTSATLNQGGTNTFTVFADGSVTGSYVNTNLNLTGNLVGTIDAAGNLNATVGFGASGNYTLKGNVVISAGSLNGTYTTTWQGNDYLTTSTATAASAGP